MTKPPTQRRCLTHSLLLKTDLYRRRGNSGGLTSKGHRRSFLSYKLGWKVFLRGRTLVLIVLGTVSVGPVTAPPGGTAVIEGGTLTWVNVHWSIIMAIKREIGTLNSYLHLLLTFSASLMNDKTRTWRKIDGSKNCERIYHRKPMRNLFNAANCCHLVGLTSSTFLHRLSTLGCWRDKIEKACRNNSQI